MEINLLDHIRAFNHQDIRTPLLMGSVEKYVCVFLASFSESKIINSKGVIAILGTTMEAEQVHNGYTMTYNNIMDD